MNNNIITCILDGKPYGDKELPKNAQFVGMEQDPNKDPRYSKLNHPWFNQPCYETPEFQRTHNHQVQGSTP